MIVCHPCNFFFFFNDTATTEIYTLSLHDALPISVAFSTRSTSKSTSGGTRSSRSSRRESTPTAARSRGRDRKSTRLNSSHLVISYAVFCLKKKKRQQRRPQIGMNTYASTSDPDAD